jgi:hypothetical protein
LEWQGRWGGAGGEDVPEEGVVVAYVRGLGVVSFVSVEKNGMVEEKNAPHIWLGRRRSGRGGCRPFFDRGSGGCFWRSRGRETRSDVLTKSWKKFTSAVS